MVKATSSFLLPLLRYLFQLKVSFEVAKFQKQQRKEAVKYPREKFTDKDIKRQLGMYSKLGAPGLPDDKYVTVSEHVKAKCNEKFDTTRDVTARLSSGFLSSRTRRLTWRWRAGATETLRAKTRESSPVGAFCLLRIRYSVTCKAKGTNFCSDRVADDEYREKLHCWLRFRYGKNTTDTFHQLVELAQQAASLDSE